MGPENAFQTLKLSGLSTTAEFRRVREQARVRQAMSQTGTSDGASQVVERLLSDPRRRLREAAAWYFAFGTHEDAAAAGPAEMGPHDRVRRLWYDVNNNAQGGTGGFAGACFATAELANNPSAWLELDNLISDIADARLDSASIPPAVDEATARWIVEGLVALVRLHSHGYQSQVDTSCGDAAQIVRNTDGLSERVVDMVIADVLERAADQLESASDAFESETVQLFEDIQNGVSDGKALAEAANRLIVGTRAWSELVVVLDDDPFSGREGHALDRVAQLIRRTAVALYNRRNDSSTAAQLLDFASYIAQSDSDKESHRRDARTVRQNRARDDRTERYIRALNEAIAALNAGLLVKAESLASDVTRLAVTEEERTEARELEAAVRSARSSNPMTIVREQSQTENPLRDNRVFAAVLGGLVALIVVIGGLAMLVASGEEEKPGQSNSNGSNSGSSNREAGAPANGQSGVDWVAERAAIEQERARLDDVAPEIEDLGAWLDQTLAQYPNGAPDSVVDRFESERSRYNRLVREYDSDLDELNRRIDAYNAR